jgi:hypothetical protein
MSVNNSCLNAYYDLKATALHHVTWPVLRFLVLTAASMKMTVWRDVTQCSQVEDYQCFRGAYCSKTVIFMACDGHAGF